MNLKGMYSLYSFIILLKKLVDRKETYLVDRKETYFELQKINYTHDEESGYSGYYFEIKYSNDEIKTTAWIGVYYERENPLICLCFEYTKGSGKTVYDKIDKQLDKIEKDEYYEKPYRDKNGVIWFELTDEKHKEFDTASLEEQIQIIKEFMDRVIMKTLKMIENE